MPIGYLITVALIAAGTVFALVDARWPGPIGTVAYFTSLLINELPLVVFVFLTGSTLLAFGEGDIDGPVGWTAVGIAALTVPGLVLIGARALKAAPAVDAAMTEGLGPEWRECLDPALLSRRRRTPWLRVLFAPFLVRRGNVKRVANLRYGPAGKRNLLDVYHHRSRPTGGPVLVYFHGGRFVSGRKNREARPVLYRLASEGWVCVSANYRLGPAAEFPDHMVDLKRVIAWAREHAHEYGADPSTVFVAGSSAGAHMAAMAALTPNDPVFQPGFDDADTTVAGAICLYGYYGRLDTDSPVPSSPLDYLRSDAPPFFVAHGDHDLLVSVEAARELVTNLRATSSQPVVYAELPGGHHAFDLFHSIRCEAVVDGIDAFTEWVRSQPTAPSSASPSASSTAPSSPTARSAPRDDHT